MVSTEYKDLFATMALIRSFEESILKLFDQGRVSGTTHTCIGQEAIAAALGANLEEGDYLFCPHRCHGHFIAYGGAPEALIAELMGKATGVCAGRGGSQHLHFNRFFSNGVQGGVVGNAVGAALALKLAGEPGIAVAVLGDGTLGQGLVYESMNFAALHSLPILFLLENNQYAQTTPTRLAVSGAMTARAQAFGIEAGETDSSDVVELHTLLGARINRVRRGSGPFFQVVNTYRLAAHSKGDDTRDPEEIARYRQDDPFVLNGHHLDEKERDALCAKAEARIARAVESAELALPAPVDELTRKCPDDDCTWEPPFVDSARTFQKALNEGLHRLLQENTRVFFMGEDVLDPYGGAFGVSKGLSSAFPERVLTTPISEAGMVAWGVGAALAGLRPVVEIMFGDFLALAADQLLNHAAKYRWISNERVCVPLVVRTPVGGGRGYGPTHSQSIEKMFMGIPGLQVVAANPLLDPGALLQRCVLHADNPTLFIEHKLLYPQPLANIAAGRFGNYYVRCSQDMLPTVALSLTDFEQPDVCLMAYGGMTPLALDAAERLLIERDIVADVVIPSRLYPHTDYTYCCPDTRARLTVIVEEGMPFCGWGAEIIARAAGQAGPAPGRFVRIAAAECPIPAAMHLERSVLPSVQKIMESIIKELE